jgi:cell wall assembly regulator SMI1
VGAGLALAQLVDDGTFADLQSEPEGPIRTEWWHPKWIPLTADGGGNHRCLDLAPRRGGRMGQIISWWHDDAGRIVMARSFTRWLDDFAEELETGEWAWHPDYDGLVPVDELDLEGNDE